MIFFNWYKCMQNELEVTVSLSYLKLKETYNGILTTDTIKISYTNRSKYRRYEYFVTALLLKKFFFYLIALLPLRIHCLNK